MGALLQGWILTGGPSSVRDHRRGIGEQGNPTVSAAKRFYVWDGASRQVAVVLLCSISVHRRDAGRFFFCSVFFFSAAARLPVRGPTGLVVPPSRYQEKKGQGDADLPQPAGQACQSGKLTDFRW